MSDNLVIHADIEPAVITADMIKDAFRDQGPKGEAGRLMEEEGYDIHTTPCKKLRLEFLNILRIDHLWMLTGLTKLQLSNNIIEKIENLTELVNLVELDLSFNKIKVIENLDTLVKLEILTLFENKIKVIENINMLKNLEIFSIGNNLIEDLNCVLLLRNFTKLKALSMAGNPCAKKGFRDQVTAFIPQLIYYEYKMISTVERENARNVQRAELEKLEAEEAKILKEKALIEANEKKLALHKEAYVEHLDKSQLFDALFENDSEGKAALLSGQEAEEIFEGFKTNVTEISQGLFNVGIEQLKIRQEEIRQFEVAVSRTKTQSIEASRGLIEEFLVKKTKIFYSTKMLLDTVESTQQVDEKDLTDISERIRTNGESLQNETTKLWNTLMGNEITLFEQIEELNTSFDRNLADLINVFVEQAQGFFTSIREKETTFMELISDHMLRFQTIVTVRNDDLTTYPPALRPMLADKDAVQAAMAASHDAHLLAIDGREDQLTSRIRDWHSNLCATLQNNEIQRNRATVSEICHFLDFQREEFDELYSKLSDTYLSVGDENLIETQYMEDRHGLSNSESSSVVTSEPPP